MFLALAIVCDDYFVSSLEKICEVSIKNMHMAGLNIDSDCYDYVVNYIMYIGEDAIGFL